MDQDGFYEDIGEEIEEKITAGPKSALALAVEQARDRAGVEEAPVKATTAFEAPAACPRCEGQGSELFESDKGLKIRQCPACEGKGLKL